MASNIPHTKQRIEFIDALKGFLIISVVMCHVAGFCLGIQDDIPSFLPVLFEIRNPPFFFVSGFFAYKASTTWSVSLVSNIIRKKFMVIALPTTLFLAILLYIHPSCNGRTFLHDGWGDIWFHWFTYALFLFFTLYATISYIMHLLRFSEGMKDCTLLLIGTGFYLLFSVETVYLNLPIAPVIKQIFGMSYWGFFFFFVLGILAKKHYTLFEISISNRKVIATCIVLFTLFNIFSEPIIKYQFNLFRIVTYLTGIILVFVFFKNTKIPDSINTCLIHFGRRTLDIYLIHYFFLPLGLHDTLAVFREYPMPAIEFFLTLTVSLIVISLSLIISKFIRLSPITAYYVMGER